MSDILEIYISELKNTWGVLGGQQHRGLLDVEVVKPIVDVGLGDVQAGGEGAGGPQVGDLGAVGHLCW